jgi:hypothetical protein
MSKIRGLNLMSEDALSQKRMWLSLNRVMERHGVSHPQFKGFMVDSTQVNWIAVRMVYGSGNPSVKMVDRERSCLLHWTTSPNRHLKNSYD